MAINDKSIEILIGAAQKHGEDSEPDHEVGDLQDYLRAMWGLLTPKQREAYVELEQVQTTYETALAEFDTLEEALEAAGE